MIPNPHKNRRIDFCQYGVILGDVVPADGNPSAEEQQIILWANTTKPQPIAASNLGGIPKGITSAWSRITMKVLVVPLLVDTFSRGANPMNYPGMVEWILYAQANTPLLDDQSIFQNRPLSTILASQYQTWGDTLLTGFCQPNQILDYGIKPLYPHRYVLNSNTLTSPIYTMTVAVSSGEGGGEFTTVRDISLASYGNSFGGGDRTAVEIEYDKCFDPPQTIAADCQLRLAVRLSALDRTNNWWGTNLSGVYGIPKVNAQLNGHIRVECVE